MITKIASLAGSVLMMALSVASAHAADFGNTRYVKQTDAAHTQSTKGTLVLDAASHQMSFTEGSQQGVVIPYAGIDAMRLENTISRLHRPFTQRVGRDEFLTVEYHAADQPQYAVFKLNGRSYREVLAALETQTGKQVQYKTN